MSHEATLRALPEPDLTMPSVEPDGPDGAHFYRASSVRAIAAQAVADHIAANTAPTGAEPAKHQMTPGEARALIAGCVICCEARDREPCPRQPEQQCPTCPHRIAAQA